MAANFEKLRSDSDCLIALCKEGNIVELELASKLPHVDSMVQIACNQLSAI